MAGRSGQVYRAAGDRANSPVPEAVASPAAFPAKPPTPQLSDSERSGAATVNTPMPGVILEVRAKAGQQVKRSDELSCWKP